MLFEVLLVFSERSPASFSFLFSGSLPSEFSVLFCLLTAFLSDFWVDEFLIFFGARFGSFGVRWRAAGVTVRTRLLVTVTESVLAWIVV